MSNVSSHFMEGFFNHIRQFTSISEELRHDLLSRLHLETYNKNDLIVREHTYCKKLYYINSGLIRSYIIKNEQDITYWFYKEDQMFSSWFSFYQNLPGFENIECLEPTEVLVLSVSDYNYLNDKYIDFSRFSRKSIEQGYSELDYLNKNILGLTAKEKYQFLIHSIPDITQRTKLGHIASFLGISKETLSRVRAQK